MSDAARVDPKEIKDRHEKGGWELDPLCTTCMDKEGENSLPWPCDAWLAADYAESLERQVDEYHEWVEEALTALPDWMVPVGHAEVHARLGG